MATMVVWACEGNHRSHDLLRSYLNHNIDFVGARTYEFEYIDDMTFGSGGNKVIKYKEDALKEMEIQLNIKDDKNELIIPQARQVKIKSDSARPCCINALTGIYEKFEKFCGLKI